MRLLTKWAPEGDDDCVDLQVTRRQWWLAAGGAAVLLGVVIGSVVYGFRGL